MKRYAVTAIKADTYRNQFISWTEFDDPFSLAEYLSNYENTCNLSRIIILYEPLIEGLYPINLIKEKLV